MKHSLIILFYLLICSLPAIGQQDYSIGGKSLLELRQDKIERPVFAHTAWFWYDVVWMNASSTTHKSGFVAPSMVSLSDHYWEELGFFCKVEIKMEQKTRFPVRFRLGSVDYVDYLEGKR